MADHPYYILSIIGVAAAATFFWRILGTYIGRKLAIDHFMIKWATATAYSTVTALSFKLLIFPEGPLGETMLLDRLIVLIVAVGVFFLAKKNILITCIFGVILFGAILYLRQ
ncbi:hypothetical protein COTS27_00133 [Spirochaetota bacterium]|nr:hypothetical protein COTS27_00133 [Spirochaetota bacterium]